MPLLGGCRGWQSALDPAGPEAERLSDIVWLFTAVCAGVWLLVVAALAGALLRHRGAGPDALLDTDPRRDRRHGVIVAAAAGVTLLVLLGLTGLSFAVNRDIADRPDAALSIRLTGHQWWWEVRYDDPRPDRVFTTANEIHVPVGVPVRVRLGASDVIHSFWVPNLMGKQDLIPGHETEVTLTARRPGVYRGQCAEFCGLQHAHMSLFVVAEPPAAFAAWRAAQLLPAAPPIEPERRRGEAAFLSSPCVMCHAVGGTTAGGRVAPDLTHVASRRSIAAGTLEMSRGNLGAWIADPQGIKPGANMPTMRLDPEALNAIVAYLAGLR
ncbi:MAG: cytochrome c oxidase subunit II [Rhodospirillaceae bacterium]|nr:cytochrome c oxidase subunit II [Rhodospirillaceae bacterium]